MKKIAFYGGSFAPFTYGHLAVVCEALTECNQLIIGIGVNPDKKERFSVALRMKMIEVAIEDLLMLYDNCKIIGKKFSEKVRIAVEKIKADKSTVTVVAYSGLTIDAAIEYGAKFMVRGYRNTADYEEEMRLYHINRRLCEIRGYDMGLLLVKTPPELQYCSSTTVCKLMNMGEYIAAMDCVSPSVHNMLSQFYLADVYQRIAGQGLDWEEATRNDFGWEKLKMAYWDKKYHNFSHVAYCLNLLKICCQVETNEKEAKLAIFWHDVMPCEAESAEYAKKELSGKVSQDTDCNLVASLILATDHANACEKDALAQIVSDIDLAILGDEVNYGVYSLLVAKENATLPYLKYVVARKRFLDGMIGKGIFQASYFKNRFEEKALANMKREKKLL